MKVFFVTDNSIWFQFLESWNESRKEQVAIYCSPAGEELFSKEIESSRISVLDLKKNADALKVNFDIGFSCHCKQIFPKELVENVPCFNFHPGLNPYNRGWFPQVFSIINGSPVGATVHKMDHKIDHGPIVAQKNIDMYSWDTSKSVYDRILNSELRLFDTWIDSLLSGNYIEIEPDDSGNYNSISDFKELCEIDLEKRVTFKEAIDYFRAMTFDGYDNSFFSDQYGRKIYVSINLKLG